MNHHLILLPQPRQVEFDQGNFMPGPNLIIQIKNAEPQKVLFTAEKLAETLESTWLVSCKITASRSLPKNQAELRIILDQDSDRPPQGYQLTIRPNKIEIKASDLPGLFYGAQTLIQIISQCSNKELPCLTIHDWPDFPNRGVMLDISRDKVYKLETLYMLIDELASWKINQLQLYMEHTFAYSGHETVWQGSSPMTAEDILRLDRFCKERFIELVPNQNSLGHMSRWLKHPGYLHLAETNEPVRTPWGNIQKTPFTLAPTLPGTLELMAQLYDQLLPNFASRQINVGCDEAFDIGMGKSRAVVEARGKGQVYLDYLLGLHEVLSKRGYRMQFWGDILLEHPDLIPQLPKDLIVLVWGYEADHPFETETQHFIDSGVPVYVCPGTSAWNSLGGRVSNMLLNCQSAAQAGLQNGAIGYLNTDWGDNGHWQQFPISYPGFAAGAAFCWCLSSNQDLDLAAILNQIIFMDSTGQLGQICLEIGEEYQRWGLLFPNSSPFFWLLQEKAEALRRFDCQNLAPIQESLSRLQSSLKRLNLSQIQRSDASLILRELRLTIQMMILACQRALCLYGKREKPSPEHILHEIKGIIAEFQALWLARNRIGGLPDSLKRFNELIRATQNRNEEN